MIDCRLFIRIFQLSLIFTNHLLFLSTIVCERLSEPKTETKVEIEITYRHRYHDDKPHLSQGNRVYKIVQFIYSIPNLPKSLTPDIRGNNRSPNNNGNLRHGFRFSTIDKGAGALSLSSYDSDTSDRLHMRSNYAVQGPLIHVASLKPNDNSSILSVLHTACDETINSMSITWIALVQGGVCSTERKLKNILKMSNPPATILIYGVPKITNKQDSFLSFSHGKHYRRVFWVMLWVSLSMGNRHSSPEVMVTSTKGI